MNQKTKMQQKLIPRTSRLLLEVTSYRDGILNRMPQFRDYLKFILYIANLKNNCIWLRIAARSPSFNQADLA